MTEQKAKAKRKAQADHAAKLKPKAKKKPRPKHMGAKPAARAPGETPKPKSAAVSGVRDPWAAQPEKREAAEAETESGNPVSTGLEITDYAHSVVETAMDAKKAGAGWAGLAEEMGEEGLKVFNGEASAVGTTMTATNIGVFGPLQIIGGAMDMMEGYEETKHDMAGGVTHMTEGGLGVASGGATILGAFGVGSAAAAAPLLGAGATGMKVGHYGDGAVKDLGWIHGDNGDAESASSWAAEEGHRREVVVTEATGNATLGRVAGAYETLTDVPIAGATAAAGAVAGAAHMVTSGGRSVGKQLANNDRAQSYATANDGIGVRNPYTGQVEIAPRGTPAALTGGRQMANYDDNLSDAVEMSKVLHPERWGEGENELSAFNKVAEQMQQGTNK